MYGENIPLAVLINVFGVQGVEALLEQNALQFVLWTSMVTYLVDDIPGVNPLQSGYVTTTVHSDPEESATAGLKWLKNQLPRRERRSLIRKVTKAYKTMPRTDAESAAKFGHEGYDSNLFAPLGLPKEKELGNLDKPQREKLAVFADQCLELAVLSSNQYDSLDSYDIAMLNRTDFSSLRDANVIAELMNILFKIEKTPEFGELIKIGAMDIADIPRIRSTRNSIKFREWISKIANEVDAESVAKEYIDAIVESKSKLEGGIGKFVRTMAVLGLSAIASVGLPTLPGVGVGTAIGLLDSYLVNAISKGWSPRYLFEKDVQQIMLSFQSREKS